jgi:hypothetical protein
MEGSERLSEESAPDEKTAWVKQAMERLDTAVADEETRRTIMTGCAHRFPKYRIEQLRIEYERLGSVDKLLEFIRSSPTWGGAPFYKDPAGDENVIYVEKIPWRAKRHEEATDEVEKRAYYCHCPMVRAAILSGEKISPTFCNCASGWFVQLWEGILGQPVRVLATETVLEGGDCCRFAIHLPLGV